MKLINEKTEIESVAERWKAAYCRDGDWRDYGGSSKEAIYLRLLALPQNATAKDIASIIGNSSWAGPQQCHECGDEDAEAVVQIGQEPDYESATADICLSCLRKAVALIESSGTAEGKHE